MTNPFANRASSVAGPAIDLVPVVPSDSVDFTDVAVSLYVETGGTLNFVSVKGEARTVVLKDGAILPVGALRVNATGTTATGIHAFTVS